MAVIGARPKVSLTAWAGVLASFGLTLLGPTFGLSDWVLAISPFWHVPVTGCATPDYSGLGWISLFTVAFPGCRICRIPAVGPRPLICRHGHDRNRAANSALTGCV
ncbi:MAG: hypothetical protein ACOYEV_09405 [Candidatus Nanopelagicales bacterium]